MRLGAAFGLHSPTPCVGEVQHPFGQFFDAGLAMPSTHEKVTTESPSQNGLNTFFRPSESKVRTTPRVSVLQVFFTSYMANSVTLATSGISGVSSVFVVSTFATASAGLSSTGVPSVGDPSVGYGPSHPILLPNVLLDLHDAKKRSISTPIRANIRAFAILRRMRDPYKYVVAGGCRLFWKRPFGYDVHAAARI